MTLNIRAIIFDLDGTLVDSYPAILESLNHTLSRLGYQPVDSERIRKMVGHGLENLMMQAVGEEHLKEGIRIFRESYDQTVLNGTFLLPDVMNTLQKLQQAGSKMGVASNKPVDYSRRVLRHLQIDACFVGCLGPEVDTPPKPHPAMLEKMMHLLGAAPEETLYVGDMALDVQSARNAKVRVALVPGGGDDLDTLRAANPDYLLSRFRELCDLV
jgi:phosphoglycolate phosphatase